MDSKEFFPILFAGTLNTSSKRGEVPGTVVLMWPPGAGAFEQALPGKLSENPAKACK